MAPAWIHEAIEEIVDELGLQVADQSHLHPVLVDQRGASAEIDRDHGESFVHRKNEVAGAIDAFAIAERLGEQLSEHDARVLHGVVLIDVEIAIGVELQVEAAVLGEELEHVIEEADSGGDFVAAAAFEFERAADARLFGVALNGGGSHAVKTSSR